jgi:hypothetical protein
MSQQMLRKGLAVVGRAIEIVPVAHAGAPV